MGTLELAVVVFVGSLLGNIVAKAIGDRLFR